MSSQIPHNGNKNMPALVAVAPLVKLPHARLKHLVGMEARILPESACARAAINASGEWPSVR